MTYTWRIKRSALEWAAVAAFAVMCMQLPGVSAGDMEAKAWAVGAVAVFWFCLAIGWATGLQPTGNPDDEDIARAIK